MVVCGPGYPGSRISNYDVSVFENLHSFMNGMRVKTKRIISVEGVLVSVKFKFICFLHVLW